MLRPVRIGVGPADEALAPSAHLAADRHVAARNREHSDMRVLFDPRPAGCLDATEHVPLPAKRHYTVAHPRRRPRPDLDAADRHVVPRVVVVAVEVRPVQPDPALRVLGAPVVADHPGPAVELHGALAERHTTAE